MTYLPVEPSVGAGIGYFLIGFPGNQMTPDGFKEWGLQYSFSTDDVSFSDWFDLATLSPQQRSYQHTNIQVGKYYRYRYQMRTSIFLYDWSNSAYAGLASLTTVGLGAGSVGGTAIVDGAVTSTKIADGSVFPQHITGTVDPFYFPGKVKSNVGGIQFPDNSIQTTAATAGAAKYAADLGAITADTPLTVTHSLGSLDCVPVVYNKTTFEEEECTVVHFSASAIKLTFSESFLSGALRVVVVA